MRGRLGGGWWAVPTRYGASCAPKAAVSRPANGGRLSSRTFFGPIEFRVNRDAYFIADEGQEPGDAEVTAFERAMRREAERRPLIKRMRSSLVQGAIERQRFGHAMQRQDPFDVQAISACACHALRGEPHFRELRDVQELV